jgi:hypothetical protein
MDKLAIAFTGSVVMIFIIALLPPALKMNRAQRDWFHASIFILGAIMALGPGIYVLWR